jgi:hypothetical protein
MPYLIAAVLAVALLLYEQVFSQRLWFVVPAAGSWLARLACEAGAAIALTLALRHIPKSVLSINGILLGAIAGALGPRGIARLRVPVLSRNVNIINIAFQRLIGPLDDNIDQHSAEAQRVYYGETLRPAAARGDITLAEVAAAFRQHLDGRHGMSDVDREKGLAFIAKVEGDSVPDEDKVVTLVLRAWQIGAYVSMKALLKRLPRRRLGTRPALKRLWDFARYGTQGPPRQSP